jgi:hypothetical protein
MSTNAHHLAQINVARAFHPLDAPEMAGFVERLDDVNALAERALGFVWRLQDESGNATDLQPFDDPRIIVNMSVWQSIEDLFAFTYHSGHTGVLRARKQWFEMPEEAHMALWWHPAGEVPSLGEGKARLHHLRDHGPTAEAFTFRQRFPAPSDQAATAA